MNEEKTNENSNEIFNNESLENVTPVQPVESTIEQVTPVQPVEPTIEQVTPVQPVESTIEQVTPVQPVYNNKGKKPIGMIISIIVILGAIVGYFLYTTLNSPKNLFLRSIDGAYKNVENTFDELLSSNNLLDNKAIVSKSDLEFKVSLDDSLLDENEKGVLNEINKIKLNTEVGYDRKNKQILAKLGSTYDSKDLLTVGAYATKENMYVELKNLFDKYIEIPVEDYDALFESQKEGTEDAKYIANTVKEAIGKNLNKDDFKKSKETLTIDSKKVKTTKVEYGLSEKKFMELGMSTLEDLSKNDKFIEKIAKITGKEKSEIKSLIQDSLTELKESKTENLSAEEVIKVSIYVKGLTNKNVGFKISFTDETENTITYLKNDKVTEINMYEGEENLFNSKTTTKNKNESDTVISMDEFKMSIHKKSEDGKTVYSYEMPVEEVNIKGNLTILNKEIKKDEKYTIGLEFTMDFVMNDTKMIGLEIKANGTTEYTDKLALPDVSNNVNYINLTEADTNTIMNNLMKNQNLISLITKINTYTQNMNSSSSSIYNF